MRYMLSKKGYLKMDIINENEMKEDQTLTAAEKSSRISQKQCGRSMVEMLGILAIVGVLSMASLAGYSKVMHRHKISTMLDQISMLVAELQSFHDRAGTYEGLDEKILTQMGILSSTVDFNGNEYVLNAFGGSVHVTPVSMSGKDLIKITAKNLPRDAALAVMTTDWGTANVYHIRAKKEKKGS